MIPAEDWDRCASWLQAALSAGGDYWTLDAVKAEIEAGRAVLWPGRACAAVTEFWDYPRGRVLNFWLLGGDKAELLGPLRTHVEAWARLQGCFQAAGIGRPGWKRALAPAGYRPMAMMMVKDL